MTPTRNGITHNGAIENDLGSNDYFPTCSCGWKGSACESMTAAESKLTAHYDEVGL